MTADPGLDVEIVRQKVAALQEKCRERNVLFDFRPKVHPQLIENYYTPGAKLEGRCLYPFLHAPTALRGALVGNSMGPVWHTQHFMTAYKPAVADLTWRALRLRAQETPLSTEELLQRAAESVRIPGLGIALHWLGRALGAILSSIDRLLGSAATAGLTVIDRMAYMLMSGKAQDAKLDDQITRLISYVVAFAGIPIAAGTMVKVAFLNYLLGFILRPLVGNARTALAQTNA